MINFLTNRLIQFQKSLALIRVNDWWIYKLAPILGTAYATATILETPLISVWKSFVFVCIAMIFGGAYASMINNICDRREDQICGKANFFIDQSSVFINVTFIISLSLGIFVSLFLVKTPLLLILYTSNWLVFTIYSVPPLRLKKRSFWGVLAMTMGESFLPQLFAVLLITQDIGKPLPIFWIILVSIWTFALGIRNILWHQIDDFENDHQIGINTLAVLISPESTQKFVKSVIFPIELLSLLGILLYLHNVIIWFFLSIYLLTEWLRNFFWDISIVIVSPVDNHRVFLMEYYDVFYPLSIICLASVRDSQSLIILGVHILFYFQRVWWWLRDFFSLLRWDISSKILKNTH